MAFGNGIPLGNFGVDARKLSAEAFELRHGSYFLLVHSLDVGTSASQHTAKTAGLVGSDGEHDDAAAVVYKIERRPSSTFPFIALGRNEKNDLHVPHSSVSRFHAYFKVENGQLLVQDAKSANGTRLGEDEVPRQGDAPAVPVPAGASLKFGDVLAVHLGSRELHAIARGH